MNLLVMLAIGLSAWDSSLNPEAHQSFVQAKSILVGTWLRPDRGLRVICRNTLDKLFIRVAYLGTYGEYKPWPEIPELEVFTVQPLTRPPRVRATAQWSDHGWHFIWILSREGRQLRVEEYRLNGNTGRRDFTVHRYNKVADVPWDDDEWAREKASTFQVNPVASFASSNR